MAYCTVAEVVDNHESIPDTGETTYITKYITWADAIINGALAGKYDLPFSATPNLINFISTTFATFFEIKRLFGKNQSEIQEWIETYYEMAKEYLDKLASCEMALFDASGEEIETVALIQSNTMDRQPIFDLRHPYDWNYHDESDDKRYGHGYPTSTE